MKSPPHRRSRRLTARVAAFRDAPALRHALVALLALVLLGAADSHADDASALGARALDAGDYAHALALLSKALEHDPRDARAWFDKGRAIAMMNAATPPDDYCDADDNWIFQALAHLAKAVRIDAAMKQQVDGDRSAFAAFRDTAEFRNWRAAIEPVPRDDAGLRAYLLAHPQWNRHNAETGTRDALTLRADGRAELFSRGRSRNLGTWTVRDGKLVIDRARHRDQYEVAASPFFVGRGALDFDVLRLGDEWTLGRILHDCDF